MIPIKVLIRHSTFIIKIASKDQTVSWLAQQIVREYISHHPNFHNPSKYGYCCRITDVRDETSKLRLLPNTKLHDLLSWYPNLIPRIYIITGSDIRSDKMPQLDHDQQTKITAWQCFSLLSSAINLKFSTMCKCRIKLTTNELKESSVPSIYESNTYYTDPFNFIFLNSRKISKAYIIPSIDETKQIPLEKHEWKDRWECSIICSTEDTLTYRVVIEYEEFGPKYSDGKTDALRKNTKGKIKTDKLRKNTKGKIEIESGHDLADLEQDATSKYNFVEVKQLQNSLIKQQIDSIWDNVIQNFMSQLCSDWNKENGINEDDMSILNELKKILLEHHRDLFTIFRHLCAKTGDAKWMNRSSFVYFIENINVLPTENKENYPKIMAAILSNIWYVINVRNQQVYKERISPQKCHVIKDRDYMSFKEFIEAVVRIAFIARIEKTNKTINLPGLMNMCIGSPFKKPQLQRRKAFLTPPECLEYIINSFCQKLVTSQVLELEDLLINEKMATLIGQHKDVLDQVFVKYATAVKSTDYKTDNKTIDIQEFNILMKTIIEKNIPIESRKWKIIDSRILSVNELKQIFYSSQRLNLKAPNDQPNKIDKHDHILDINEFYEAIIRSGFRIFSNSSKIKKIRKYVTISNNIEDRISCFINWLELAL